MNELSVVDTRTIIRVIKENFGFDFSGFAHTSLKYRLAKVMAEYKIREIDVLIEKLNGNKTFFDNLLHDILAPATEMFRDPSLWRWLKEEHLTEIKNKHIGPYKIWLPLCVHGFELYTLAIVLKELNMLENVKIIAGVLSEKSIEVIKEGILPLKKHEISQENYKRYQGTANFNDYIEKRDYFMIRDKSLINSVEFVKQDYLFQHAPKNVKLILFRNQCIYYNSAMQEDILTSLHNQLSSMGILVIGANERIKNIDSSDQFEVLDEGESVFKRKYIGKE